MAIQIQFSGYEPIEINHENCDVFERVEPRRAWQIVRQSLDGGRCDKQGWISWEVPETEEHFQVRDED